MTIDLAECRAKIQRAHEHRNALDAVIKPVVSGTAPEADLVRIGAKLDPQSGQHVFRVATIPNDWGLRVGVILGDVVHNLRSALDYLFWQLYCHHIRVPLTNREAKTVQFPIEDEGQRFANKRGTSAKSHTFNGQSSTSRSLTTGRILLGPLSGRYGNFLTGTSTKRSTRSCCEPP
jgi:hypothetical protein